MIDLSIFFFNIRQSQQVSMSNIFIPVILGTTRQGRMSEPVANFVYEQVKQWHNVETELIDIR